MVVYCLVISVAVLQSSRAVGEVIAIFELCLLALFIKKRPKCFVTGRIFFQR